MDLASAAFWAALGSIIWVNVLLSGDNAVVIAMAARTLPPRLQRKAIFWGSAAAIAMRIVLTIIALELLQWPYLKIVGGVLLLYVGVTLLCDDDNGGEQSSNTGGNDVLAAIRTILIADLVMSLDNVLAVAAAAKGNVRLLVAGLAMSIPLIIFGSTLLLKVMDRLPLLVTAGAALLGWLAGEMLLTDPAVGSHFGEPSATMLTIGHGVGAATVVCIGTLLQRRRQQATPATE